MNILVLESGADFWGVALAEIETEEQLPFGGSIRSLAVAIENDTRSLAGKLFSKVQSVFDLSERTKSELDAIAVGIGPGSWTGLRIGITAMKTMAQTLEIPLVGVPSFDPIAQAACRSLKRDEAKSTSESTLPESPLLLVTAPCRPGELYGKLYDCCSELPHTLHAEVIKKPREFAELLAAEALERNLTVPSILTGPGAGMMTELLTSCGQAHTVIEPKREAVLVEMAISGADAVFSGETSDPLTLAPLYLAPSNAERNLVAVG